VMGKEDGVLPEGIQRWYAKRSTIEPTQFPRPYPAGCVAMRRCAWCCTPRSDSEITRIGLPMPARFGACCIIAVA